MPDNLFNIPETTTRDDALIAAYADARRTLDDLPYTREFDTLFATVGAQFDGNQGAVFRRLHTLRKAGRLPKSSLRGVSPVAVTPEEEQLLIGLVVREAGTLGQRDQLPFTPKFDVVAADFATATRRDLTPHDLWRLIARLAK
jgi:hypothetical protein